MNPKVRMHIELGYDPELRLWWAVSPEALPAPFGAPDPDRWGRQYTPDADACRAHLPYPLATDPELRALAGAVADRFSTELMSDELLRFALQAVRWKADGYPVGETVLMYYFRRLMHRGREVAAVSVPVAAVAALCSSTDSLSTAVMWALVGEACKAADDSD